MHLYLIVFIFQGGGGGGGPSVQSSPARRPAAIRGQINTAPVVKRRIGKKEERRIGRGIDIGVDKIPLRH